ncbi:MAG: hypothetical protein ACREP4_04050 [Stenotrophomonas sp.]|uniref:hypothetical protein n=1 Tax=Stenotrophomonas sp. TaxID=69392 RepID=UPI003D6D69E0
MSASARNISAAVIGCHGLDVLHMMRLKVASSLLMAEYIQAEVHEWNRQKVDLLVAFADDAEGQLVVHEARHNGVPVLAVSRRTLAALSVPGVAYGASVRDIFQHLRQLLQQQEHPVVERPPSRTLFASLAQSKGSACELHMGLFKLQVNAERSRVTLLRDLPYENCLKAAAESNWTLTLATSDTLDDAVSQHVFEDFCWQAAALVNEPLVPVEMAQLWQLRGWPEVQTGALPVAWLLPMAALMQRPWRCAELALAIDMPQVEIARIMAAAACSGLLDTAVVQATSRTSGSTVTGFFTRIAKRFGLTFKGLQD